MDESNYDEFGNYVGPDVDSEDDLIEDDNVTRRRRGISSVEEEEEEEEDGDWGRRRGRKRGDGADEEMRGDDEDEDEDEENDEENEEEPTTTAIVLAEDKKYYPSAREVYGEDTETLVETEDAQALEVPIIASANKKRFEIVSEDSKLDISHAKMKCKPEFLEMLWQTPVLSRNVCIAGHLHHGKSSLVDALVEETHDVSDAWKYDDNLGSSSTQLSQNNYNALRLYTDTRLDERSREMSIKAVPMTLPLADGKHGKTHSISIFDTPGHANFCDEVSAAARIADGFLIVVDAAEGVMCGTEKAIKIAARENVPCVLFINKIDRLIVELKLPPADAYHKLRHVIEECNALIEAAYGPENARLCTPLNNRVCFGSSLYGFSFTLESFAKTYKNVSQSDDLDHKQFAKRLWGDAYFDEETRAFKKKPPVGQQDCQRSFVQFILEPLYKLFSQAVGEAPESFQRALKEFNRFSYKLKPKELKQNTKPLIKLAFSKVFLSHGGLTDILLYSIPNPIEGAESKISRTYTGELSTSGRRVRAMQTCDKDGPLAVQIVKLYPSTKSPDAFDAFGRVLSGTLCVNDSVKVLGEAYSPDDEEDCAVKTVSHLWINEARYRIPVQSAPAGCWVLIAGVDQSIVKTATLVSASSKDGEEGNDEDVYTFKPLEFENKAVVKIAVEPLHPSDLPKMVEGLRKISKTYPALQTKVEESGEHIVVGMGEIYLDSAMKDLREVYADIEVKVADPVVVFAETVVETSALKCFAETPNKRNKITMIAEPLDKGLGLDIESKNVVLEWPKKHLANFFTQKYDWDALAARSVWAFGPDSDGPNVLMDDTLPSEVDKDLLMSVRESIVQGFQWGTREGPLCEEPIRETKFKILDATISSEPLQRGGGQIIPTSRRCVYSAFLTAQPRLMEPVYAVEIQTPADCMTAIYNVLSKRRGHVVSDVAKPGTPVYIVKALLPAIESFGFETDLRAHTRGMAFGLSYFDHWSVVPGDPLDRAIQLRPLEPSPVSHLAREFCIKTRRRKGMGEDISASKFFDSSLLEALEGVTL